MKKLVCTALIALPLSAVAADDLAPRIGSVIDGSTVMYAGADGPCGVVAEKIALEGGGIWCAERFSNGERRYPPLGKSFESTTPGSAPLLLGHTIAEIKASPRDLLGAELLKRFGDPDYDTVASVFAPIQKMSRDTYSFVGMPETTSKVGFAYSGRSPDFDPAILQPSIDAVVKAGKVANGLVGGYLPILRFVYPETPGTWTEMLAFAPPRVVNGNTRLQPVWYRVVRVEDGKLKWARYVDSYQPFPPRAEDDAATIAHFYTDLFATRDYWEKKLAGSMTVSIPDQHLSNLAKFSLVRTLMTRQQGFPKYGAIDKDYGNSEHDGFPDTFNAETTAMIEWRLLDEARSNIDNYFTYFVRDDGMLLYRGPETGQFGRMLTVLAQYVNDGGDAQVLLAHRARIDAVTGVLLALRKKALTLPKTDPAYGLLAGWSEADASLEKDPSRYMQPYFSNSTEAERGFRDLGRVWLKIAAQSQNEELAAHGFKLLIEAQALKKDLVTAISRSWLQVDGTRTLPSIAGAKEPFHLATKRDPLDPQYRSYRAFMEMLFSGNLAPDVANSVIDYRATHNDVLLGVPEVYGYNTGIMGGFLAYGHGYGLIQRDRIREALLMTYSHAAHQYTRGTWLAPETRYFYGDDPAAPYATPAQVVAPLMLKWLLVFEDPNADVLWLGKGAARQWLEDGKRVAVLDAPTRFGTVGFEFTSHSNAGVIDALVGLPAGGIPRETRLRIREPHERRIKSVTLNGKPWNRFNVQGEYVVIPAGMSGEISISVKFRPPTTSASHAR